MVNAADLKSAAAKAAWGFEPPSRHGEIIGKPAMNGAALCAARHAVTYPALALEVTGL